MDKELKQELEWMNENLKAIVDNQYVLCLELKKIEDALQIESNLTVPQK